LDAALNALPEKYRQALVLVHLESLLIDEAAARLALRPGALRMRLTRGRELLRRKLVGNGVAVGSVGALTALLAAETGAAVLPPTFIAATARAATGAGTVSASVAALTEGALHTMMIAKVQAVAVTAVACLFVAGGGAVLAQQMSKSPETAGRVAAEPQAAKSVFSLQVKRIGGSFGPKTVFHRVAVSAVEKAPHDADVPKPGDVIAIAMPDTLENRDVFKNGAYRVNLVRKRISFPKNPRLDHYQYRFPDNKTAGNIQRVDAGRNPGREANAEVSAQDLESGSEVRVTGGRDKPGIAAYDRDGKLLWKASLEKPATELVI
jgi:hypothetical protein